jgi:hypothetical protein
MTTPVANYETLRVLAFDPGVTTGIAYRPKKGEYATCVVKTPEEAWEFIDPKSVDLCIFEDFQAQLISRYGIHTVQVVGGIKARCAMYKIDILLQRPQQRRAFIDIAARYLKEHRGGTGTGAHEKDALSHILSWEWRQEHPHDVP